MNWTLYGMIFLSKVIENALATLRLIVVSNGKKLLGAILQLCVAVVWVLVTGAVVVGIGKDPFKIIFFCLGSFVGSYTGSMIEEKMAMGSNLVFVITEKEKEEKLVMLVRSHNFVVTVLTGDGLKSQKSILMIMVSRKKRRKLVSTMRKLDPNVLVISEAARMINGTIEMNL